MSERYPRGRFRAFAAAVALALMALLVRLAVLQLGQHGKWERMAAQQSTQQREVPARRGTLLDRWGYPLALTEQRVKVGVVDPRAWLAPARTNALAKALHISAVDVRGVLTGRTGHTYVCKEAALSPMVVDSLRRVDGLSVEWALHRNYPFDGLAARLLGRVNHRGRGDAGLERGCDAILAGQPGRELVRYAAGANRGPLMAQVLQPPVDGREVTLTLDHRVQMILEEELERTLAEVGAQQALGIVMQPWTGEVLALASAPGLPQRDERPFVGDEWRNPAVEDAFEPGSTFKLFTMGSLLSRGVCDTARIFDGEKNPVTGRGVADFGGFRISDPHPVGRISLRHAFEVSSNVVLAKAGTLLERDELHSDLRRFGFGARTASGLPGESNGLLAPVARWSKRTQATVSFGQEISVNLLQLAAGYSALLTDGSLRTPRFVLRWQAEDGGTVEPSGGVVRQRVVPPNIIPLLRELCRGVVESDHGTGKTARVDGLSIGGKTGTAQFSGPHGYIEGAYTASFIGFTPVDSPRLLCAIVVHRPRVAMRWGAQTAGPCFARVMAKILAGTEWLDDSAGALAAEPLADARAIPDLLGRTSHEVVTLLEDVGLRLDVLPDDGGAQVIGQIPPPGALVARGAVVHLAWTGRGAP